MEKKLLNHLRYLARQMGLSVITGVSENIYVSNKNGKWKTDINGDKYKMAFVPAKTYGLKKINTGEIITPVVDMREIKGSENTKLISDITLSELEKIVTDLWSAWKA